MNIVYLCGVDWQHEFEEGSADIYNSIEALKDAQHCWGECGIVRLELDESGNEVSHRWIVEQDLFPEKH